MSQQIQSAKTGVTSKKRSHGMRFGASVKDNGTVVFRLWAPSCKSVQLALFDGTDEQRLEMEPNEGGWFVRTEKAKPGLTYKYVTDEGLAVPDSASRFQPNDVHGSSQIVDPTSFQWT